MSTKLINSTWRMYSVDRKTALALGVGGAEFSAAVDSRAVLFEVLLTAQPSTTVLEFAGKKLAVLRQAVVGYRIFEGMFSFKSSVKADFRGVSVAARLNLCSVQGDHQSWGSTLTTDLLKNLPAIGQDLDKVLETIRSVNRLLGEKFAEMNPEPIETPLYWMTVEPDHEEQAIVYAFGQIALGLSLREALAANTHEYDYRVIRSVYQAHLAEWNEGKQPTDDEKDAAADWLDP